MALNKVCLPDGIYLPDEIYLQVVDEDGEVNGEVTWCEERIFDTDVKYIRAVACEDCRE